MQDVKPLIFIDTEFTDFQQPELISIALVMENGEHFYAECQDFSKAACSDFVVETILPLLNRTHSSVVGKTPDIAEKAIAWLRERAPAGFTLAFDYIGDYELFLRLMDDRLTIPFEALNIWPQLDESKLNWYFDNYVVPRHHALYDARANRFAYAPASAGI